MSNIFLSCLITHDLFCSGLVLGMMSSFVQRYLREQVLKFFEAKPKKPVKKG
jgi:hypothetical protein